MTTQKIVVCGAGFLGSNIAREIASSSLGREKRRVQLSSRHPETVDRSLRTAIPDEKLLPPCALDITKPASLVPAFKDANVIVSLVGVMHGSQKAFEDIQWRGAENVATAAKDVGAKLIHISAIGADVHSSIPYARTKGLAEKSVLQICPDATILRPSIVFGPRDDFFNRFSKLSKFLPFLPVFGGGTSRFQPVYVGDLARAVEVLSRNDPEVNRLVAGKYVEAGGPDVFTYREIMQIVLRYNHRRRPIISLPFQVGMLQGAVLEKLPVNLFTVTRSQIEQLKSDNIVNPSPPSDHVSFKDLLERFSGPLSSVHDVLPAYFK